MPRKGFEVLRGATERVRGKDGKGIKVNAHVQEALPSICLALTIVAV